MSEIYITNWNDKESVNKYHRDWWAKNKWRDKLRRPRKGGDALKNRNPDGTFASRENHHKWKGGFKKDGTGHILIRKPNHPKSNSHGYVYRSHLIWEYYNKEYIEHPYIIHHINKIPNDDRIENLQKITKSKHSRLHKLGTKVSKETKEKKSKTLKKLYKEGKIKPYWLGKKFTEEHKRNMSKGHQRRKICL